MNGRIKILGLALLAGCILAPPIQASTVSTVYEKTGTFENLIDFTDSFQITQRGIYEAILTDFENRRPFTDSSLDISNGTSSLGNRSGAPGKSPSKQVLATTSSASSL